MKVVVRPLDDPSFEDGVASLRIQAYPQFPESPRRGARCSGDRSVSFGWQEYRSYGTGSSNLQQRPDRVICGVWGFFTARGGATACWSS
jgi:hypothetical protein